MRTSVAIVWLCQVFYHAPVIAGAGYTSTGGFLSDLARFAASDLPVIHLGVRIVSSGELVAGRLLSQFPQHDLAMVVPQVVRGRRERVLARRDRDPARHPLRARGHVLLRMDAVARAIMAGPHPARTESFDGDRRRLSSIAAAIDRAKISQRDARQALTDRHEFTERQTSAPRST